MSIAIEETREYLQEYAESLANLVDTKDDNEEHAAFMLQAVDALDELAKIQDSGVFKATEEKYQADIAGLEATVKHFVRRFNNVMHEMEQLRQDVG